MFIDPDGRTGISTLGWILIGVGVSTIVAFFGLVWVQGGFAEMFSDGAWLGIGRLLLTSVFSLLGAVVLLIGLPIMLERMFQIDIIYYNLSLPVYEFLQGIFSVTLLSSHSIEDERRENIRQRNLVRAEIYCPTRNQTAWNRLNQTQRQALLTRLMAELQVIMGTSVNPQIEWFRNGDRANDPAGGFHSSRNSISINLDRFTTTNGRREVLHAVAHELRHAFQYESFRNPDMHIVAQQTNRAWQVNWFRMISPGWPNAWHMESAIEWDAYMFTGFIDRNRQFRNHTRPGEPLAPLRLLEPINYLSWYETRWW